MDANNLIGSIVTVVFFITFIGIIWWAYGSSRKERFEQDGLIPFEDADESQTAKEIEAKLGEQK